MRNSFTCSFESLQMKFYWLLIDYGEESWAAYDLLGWRMACTSTFSWNGMCHISRILASNADICAFHGFDGSVLVCFARTGGKYDLLFCLALMLLSSYAKCRDMWNVKYMFIPCGTSLYSHYAKLDEICSVTEEMRIWMWKASLFIQCLSCLAFVQMLYF